MMPYNPDEEFVEFIRARGESVASLKKKYNISPVEGYYGCNVKGKRVVYKTKDMRRVLKKWKSAYNGYTQE